MQPYSLSSHVNSQPTHESSLESKAWDKVIKVLKDKGQPNHFNVALCSPLYAAVLIGDLELCKKIVEMGFPINKPGVHFSETPLYQAICPGKEEIALYLIEKGADLRITDQFGNCYLHLAVNHSLPQIVDALILGGACINAQIAIPFTPDLSCAKYTSAQEEPTIIVTPLYLALRQDDKANSQQIAAALIKNGADINYRGPNGFNFLHLAAYKGYAEICKLLIERGIDVNTFCDLNADPSTVLKITPLHFTVLKDRAEATKILLEKGAKPPLTLKNAKYHPFVQGLINPKINEEITKELILHGALESEYEELQMPFILDLPNYIEILERAQKIHFNPNFKFSNQETYLHWAVRLNGFKDLWDWLIKAGADIHALNGKKQSVLHLAAGKHDQDLISLLLERGANARCIDKDALTPVMHAEEKNFLAADQYPALQAADEGLTSFMHKLRLLGLRYSLKGKAFEGAYNFLTYQDMASSLDKYLKTQSQLPPFFHTLPQIIEQSFNSDYNTIMSKLKNGEIVAVSTGWPGHETVIVLTKDCLIKGNRGGGSEEESGMKIYKIGRPENLEKAIKTLLDNKKWVINPEELWQRINGEQKENASKELLNSFEAIAQKVLEQNAKTATEHYELIKASAIKNHIQFFNKDIIDLLGLEDLFPWPKKGQTAGNCTWEGAKMALNGCLIAYHLRNNPSITKEEIVSHCHEFTSPWKKFDLAQSLTILEEAEKEPLIKEFVDFEKIYDELFVLNIFNKEALAILCRQRPRLLEWIDKPDPKLMSYGYEHQNYKIIKWFLEKGIEPNTKNLFDCHHPKIEKLHFDYLVKKGIKSNVQNNWGYTPLHNLCSKKDTSMAYELLKQWKQQCEQSNEMHLLTAALNTPTDLGICSKTPLMELFLSPLYITLEPKDIHSRKQIIDLMIECGALSVCKETNALLEFVEHKYKTFNTQLIEIVKSLLQFPDAKMAMNDKFNSCLQHLVEADPEIMKLLIQAGAQPSASVLEKAILANNNELVKVLISTRVVITPEFLDLHYDQLTVEQFKLCLTMVAPNTNILYKAVLFEKPIEVIRALLDGGAKGNSEILRLALRYDNAEIIQKLIHEGAIPEQKMLGTALYDGTSIEVIQTLLSAGLVPNEVDLWVAVRKKISIEIIQSLIKAGAVPEEDTIKLAEIKYPEAAKLFYEAKGKTL